MNGSPPLSFRWVLLAAGLLVVSAGVAILYFFDPATSGFFPVCALHQLTGLQCPGCGGLRAAHQLLHGHLGAAWRLNPLAVVILPAALLLCLSEWMRRRMGCQEPEPILRASFGWTAAAALVAFGILRNLR